MKRVLLIILVIILFIVVVFFYGFYKVNKKDIEGISVLAYHHFVTSEEKEKYYKDNYNVISTELFEEQMKYLKENGYKSVTPEDVLCYVKDECKIPKKAFLITMDDGNISTYYKALPILEKYGYTSINFIISSRIGVTTNEWDPESLYFLGQDLIDDINNNHKSMIIGSHTDDLHDLIDGKNPIEIKTEEEVLEDVSLARKKLNNTKYIAYPFGTSDEKYIKAVEGSGYELAFTFKDMKKVRKGDNIYLLPRIEIRSDYSMNDFKAVINEKVTLKRYTKDVIKKLFNIN